MKSVDGKEKYDAFNIKMHEQQPSITQTDAKTSCSSNVKTNPQAQNKGKAKAPAKPHTPKATGCHGKCVSDGQNYDVITEKGGI
ncbi:hypothetical protein O181_021592 [Austropuccinia psidii MF-1]|uniref:Uncharacterized protein n=1 Tax=Austropuccinia psidii MF-1 TaxID=1389203 RepID=A0A9Q3CFT8_9BASI|nr:hypothetical protein [Austropuccinia psidii MF-1]